MDKFYYTYILTNQSRSSLYIGVTSDLVKRIWQHKNGEADGFTKKYKLKNLVLYEVHNLPEDAIKREKQLKNWHREWKENFVTETNPEWRDLYDEILK